MLRSPLGRLFQRVGPSTLNDLDAKVFFVVLGISSLLVSSSERSPLLLGM